GTNTTPAYTTTTPYQSTAPPVTVKPSKKVQKRIAHAHHDLKRLVTDPSLGATQAIAVSASQPATTPSALSSVFDIGSGPTALFAMLAAVAIVLLGRGVLRGRRQKL